MNLIDEAEIKKNSSDQNQAQKKLIAIIVVLAILIIAAVMIVLQKNVEINKKFKFYIDGKSTAVAKDLFRTAEDGSFITGKDATGKVTYYISVKDFAGLIAGYTGYTGLPNSYIEHDFTNSYIENSYERTIFTSSEKKILKYEFLNNNSTVEIPISDQIITQGEVMYAPSDAIEKAFNVKIQYTADNNSFKVYTLNYLVQAYGKEYPLSAVKASANSSTPSYEEYQNQKAITRGFLVLQDPTTGKLGVLNLEDANAIKDFKQTNTLTNTNNLEIGLKYSAIRFMEENESFYVKTDDSKVGIINNDGTSIVNPIYLFIDTLDAQTGTYVAQSDTGRYGVIDKNQRTIIPFDFDEIGIKDTYGDPYVKNKYLLLNYYVPVKNSEGYTFYSIAGARLVSNQSFKGIGCINNSSQTGSGSRGVVIIPDLNSIVVSYDEPVTGTDGRTSVATFYGIVGDLYAVNGNVTKMDTIAYHFTQIYARELSGKTTYMALQEGTTVDVVQYINDYYSQLQQRDQGTGAQENAVAPNNNGENNEGDNSSQNATPSQG